MVQPLNVDFTAEMLALFPRHARLVAVGPELSEGIASMLAGAVNGDPVPHLMLRPGEMLVERTHSRGDETTQLELLVGRGLAAHAAKELMIDEQTGRHWWRFTHYRPHVRMSDALSGFAFALIV